MKILVFKLNSLGDNVVFVPVIQALRSRFPDWRITLLTTPNEAELYGGPLGPQERIIYEKSRFNGAYKRPWELARWVLRTRAMAPDACLVAFDQSNVAHLAARFSGARVRVGGNLERIRVRHSLTEVVPLPGDLRPVTWNWRMAGELVKTLAPSAPWPETPPPPDLSHLLADSTPPGTRLRVVVHPGAGGMLNQWGEERFARVAAALASDFDVAWIRRSGHSGPVPKGAELHDVATVSELARSLAQADLYLGNNSGPMHLANALGRHGVAVTGPTSTGWNPYWHPERWTILRHPNLACSPCEKPTVALEGCANREFPMACFAYWTEDKVEAACRSSLASLAEGRP
jgi:ADP-heptose:LPS heptosyltransferase